MVARRSTSSALSTAEAFIDLTLRRGWTTAEWSAWMKRLL
jgi:hypothetical protein